MAKTTAPKTTNIRNSLTQTHKHYRLRGFLAGLFGLITVGLIMLSIFCIWLDSTFTNTKNYVAAVTPLSSQTEIQKFVAVRTTDVVLDNAPAKDIAAELLPTQSVDVPDEQLKDLLRPVIEADFKNVVSSPQFAALWKESNQKVHTQLIALLKGQSSNNTIDMHSLVTGTVDLLKTTELSFVVDKLDIPADAGRVTIESDKVDKAKRAYDIAQKSILVLVVVASLLMILTIFSANSRLRATKGLLIGVGLANALNALVLSIKPEIKLGNKSDALTQSAFNKAASVILHSLETVYFTIFIICVVLFVLIQGWQIYSRRRANS